MGREVWVEKEDNNHPIFWDFEKNGVLYGKRNKVHTVQIAVKVPKLHADLRLEVTSPDGKQQIIEGESHSWTRNFYNWLSAGMGICPSDATNFQDGNINGKDTGGTVRSGITYPFCISSVDSTEGTDTNGYLGLVANSSFGIQVGTGSGAEDLDNYILTTQVAHGVNATQLYYQTSPRPAPDIWTSGTRTQSYKLTRFFDNFSGGTITLKEIGQVGSIMLEAAYRNFLVARDLIADLVVADKTVAMISYIYSLVFPSTDSPLRNFYNYLFSQYASVDASNATNFQDGNINIKDTGGTVRSGASVIGFAQNGSFGGFVGAINSNTRGAQIGTGNTATSFDDNTLETLIAHGTGGSQMSYGAGETPLRVWSDPTMTIQHARTMVNTSGASITVKEIGLVGNLRLATTAYNMLFLRNVISDVAVANGESIRPVHQFQVVYP